ncbi:MAG: biotin--[acetyl-CoA-carboxylase] ligase [Thermoplasmata archaeon]|nr:MAG: biotin--[acetyl-CoA-carboxylase] ligase [Thermoplasmata archaeon]
MSMRRRLLSLLREDAFVSGEKLADILGVSRAAVWKQVTILRKKGYIIDSVRNKGYRLVSKPDIPYPEEVMDSLHTRVVGRRIFHFKTLSSTNVFARKLIGDGVEEGTVVVADTQYEGRGRMNRKWFSPEGGLWFSVVLYPNIPPHRAMLLTMAASVGVAEGIKHVTGIKLAIKWPNDLLTNEGKKICGILTEIDAEIDRINSAVVGIGINVNNELPESLRNQATTLTQTIGSKISRVQILRSIIKSFDENYSKIIDGDPDFVHRKWRCFSNMLNCRIKVVDGTRIATGMVVDVDENGCLLLENTRGEILRIRNGDVKYL